MTSTSVDRGMATSTRGYKKALFAKWEDRAKELDDVFYTEWSDEIEANFYSDWAARESFYSDWCARVHEQEKKGAEIVPIEARKDIREELDDEFYCDWAAHENFYSDWADEIDMVEALLSSYAKDIGSELGWCERCQVFERKCDWTDGEGDPRYIGAWLVSYD